LPVGAQQYEIADVPLEILDTPPLHAVIKTQFEIADAHAPRTWTASGEQALTTGSGVHKPPVDRWVLRKIGNFPARAGAGINISLVTQVVEYLAVGFQPARLPDRVAIPDKTEVRQRTQNGFCRSRHIARRIHIFDAQ